MVRRSVGPHFGFALAVSLIVVTGCVERTVTITTVPDGATVILNDQEVGTSPVTVPFTWYGDYDLICRKQGFATDERKLHISTPWYQIPIVDLVTENLTPVTFRDHRAVQIDMQPEQLPTREELLSRGAEFRDRALYQGDQ